MACLTDLPHEILHSCFAGTNPVDLAALSLTCRAFNSFIYKNRCLFKEVYLKKFDDRPKYGNENETAWESLLPALVKLEKILASTNPDTKKPKLEYVVKTVVDLLQNTVSEAQNPVNASFLAGFFKESTNVDSFLCNSSLFQRARGDSNNLPANQYEQQLSAKLHCYHGVPVEYPTKTNSKVIYPFAASRVYDLRQYTDKNFWGPFLDDGSQHVDWEKVEAIMVVLGHNSQIFSDRTNGILWHICTDPFAGASPDSYLPGARSLEQSLESLDLQDPYNVTGTWWRVVCFLDYAELFSYNFSSAPPAIGEPREPLDTGEAIRLIRMNLKVKKIEAPGPGDGQALPVVHFSGTSRSMHESPDPNANSVIRGCVRLTPEGEVRWTTFSVYYGEDRWRSEGIQIGGHNSARGVFGNWFDKNFDAHGPVGPTAFWKVSDVCGDTDKP